MSGDFGVASVGHERRKNDSWDKVLNNVESSLDRKVASLEEEEDTATFDEEDDQGTAIVRGPAEQSTPFTARTMTIVVTSVLLSLILLALLLVLLRSA